MSNLLFSTSDVFLTEKNVLLQSLDRRQWEMPEPGASACARSGPPPPTAPVKGEKSIVGQNPAAAGGTVATLSNRAQKESELSDNRLHKKPDASAPDEKVRAMSVSIIYGHGISRRLLSETSCPRKHTIAQARYLSGKLRRISHTLPLHFVITQLHRT